MLLNAPAWHASTTTGFPPPEWSAPSSTDAPIPLIEANLQKQRKIIHEKVMREQAARLQSPEWQQMQADRLRQAEVIRKETEKDSQRVRELEFIAECFASSDESDCEPNDTYVSHSARRFEIDSNLSSHEDIDLLECSRSVIARVGGNL